MDVSQLLGQYGLTTSETRVYLYLLENGLCTPPQIASGTGIARTNGYHILGSLVAMQLITEKPKGKRKAYIASDPEALLRSFDARRESLAQIVPDLRALYAVQKNKPSIRFFDGWEEVKHIYAETYEADAVYAIGSTKQLSSIQENFLSSYVTGLKEREIMLRDILSHESGKEVASSMKEMMKGYYDFEVLPSSYEELETDILVWNDSVALISLSEPYFGTVLTHRALAHTFRTLFGALSSGLRGS